jgi:hypothetical protein
MRRGLFIFSECGRDAMFYECIAERVRDEQFSAIHDLADIKPQKNAPWREVLRLARKTILRLKAWAASQHIGIIIAVDNDRAPGHPGGKMPSRPLPKDDRKKAARYKELAAMLRDEFGADRTQWPVDVALAVPVEMLESWVLHLIDPTRGELPLFSRATKPGAIAFHGRTPPPQLKDLRDEAAASLSMNQDELFFHAAGRDLAAAEAVSPSLQMFTDELRQWRTC